MKSINDLLLRRLKNKHNKLAVRFQKGVEEGNFQQLTLRKRYHAVERLKRLEKQLKALSQKSGFSLQLGFKHWAVALALGVVVTTANAQTKDGSKTDKVKFSQRQGQSSLAKTEAQTLFFTEVQQLGEPYPFNVLSGDIDGDGDDDFIYVSYLEQPILAINEGGFSFTQSKPFPLGPEIIRAVYLEDFDGDGDLDFLVAQGEYGLPAASMIYLNDGAGNFTGAPQVFPVEIQESNSFFVNVDADADLDLIHYDYVNQQIKVYTNSGLNFTYFSVAQTYNGATEIYDVSDIDGDGDIDVVFRGLDGAAQAGVRLALNDGVGNFLDPAGFHYGGYFDKLAVGDIDNDGDGDIILGQNSYPNVNLVTLVNNGGYAFENIGYAAITNAQFADFINLVDIDGDNDLDINFRGENRETVILENTNGTTFLSATTLPNAEVRLVNLNGDANLDLIAYEGNLKSYQNTGTFVFTPQSDILTIGSTYDIDLVDVDLDGDLDIVQSTNMRVWLNDGIGSFTIGDENLGVKIEKAVFGSLDADADIDMIAIPDGNGGFGVYDGLDIWSNSTGANIFNLNTTLGSGIFQAQDIALADLDGDSDLDIVATTRISSTYYLRTFINNGGLAFSDGFNQLLAASAKVSVGTMDADGDVDIIVTTNSGLTVYLNDGTGTAFSPLSTVYTSGGLLDAENLIVADFDNDSNLDVFALNSSESIFDSYIFINDGTGALTVSPNVLTNSGYSNHAIVGDLDNDGDNDIIITGYFSGNTAWVNDGTGNFVLDDVPLGKGDEGAVPVLGDLDGDSDLDLVIGGYYVANKVFLNSSVCDPLTLAPDLPSLIDLIDECAIVAPIIPTASNNCGDIIDGVPDVTFPIDTQGTTVVTWTFDDGAGNVVTQTQNIIVEDITPPTVLTQPTIVELNRAGTGSIVPADVDAGSTDNCAIVNLSLDISNFSIADLGNVEVTLTAEDSGGNITSDFASVTINAHPIYYDSLALVEFYNLADGSNWTDNTNWLTGNLDTWAGISVAGDRVTAINMPNNNIIGPIPTAFSDLSAVTGIDLSGNQINEIQSDLSGLTALTSINLSDNNLDFGDFELIGSLPGLVIGAQTPTGQPTEVLVPVGQPTTITFDIGGSNNEYTWFRNGVVVEGETSNTVDIAAIGRNNMGGYQCEVTNTVIANLTITSPVNTVLATAEISGKLKISATDPATSGIVRLLEITNSGGYDTTGVVNVTNTGDYNFSNVILRNYLLVGAADTLTHPNALPTYYAQTPFWAEADTLFLEGNITQDLVSIFYTNPSDPAQFPGTLTGFLEEEIPDGGRTEARGRVSGAGVSMRRGRATGRTEGSGELAYYVYTNDNGEFDITGIEPGEYNIDIQYPGNPMDETSFIDITIGTDPKEQEVAVEALVIDGKITVRQLVILGTDVPTNGLLLYPNPTNDILKLADAQNRGGLQMEIFNMSGQQLKQVQLQTEEGVSVADLPLGQYLVTIKDQKGKVVLTQRILIK